MVNSILSAIPNVFMACIDLDQAGIDAVDKLRNFSLGKLVSVYVHARIS
jgi:hypothetical protein